jgi:hypothetical protein
VVIDGLADQTVLLPTFHEHRKCWEAVVDASEGCWVRMDVPYESTSLPGYLLRPDNSGAARPTFVVTNGSDSSLPSMLVHRASEALSRGWNAFLYGGPGQQAMRFERNVPFRYDWEAVLTPVIDALVERPEVDPSAMTGYGVSQGGYWTTRAVAFEHPMMAAVAEPGTVDLSEGGLSTWRHPCGNAPVGPKGRLQRRPGRGQRQPGRGPGLCLPEQALRRQ